MHKFLLILILIAKSLIILAQNQQEKPRYLPKKAPYSYNYDLTKYYYKDDVFKLDSTQATKVIIGSYLEFDIELRSQYLGLDMLGLVIPGISGIPIINMNDVVSNDTILPLKFHFDSILQDRLAHTKLDFAYLPDSTTQLFDFYKTANHHNAGKYRKIIDEINTLTHKEYRYLILFLPQKFINPFQGPSLFSKSLYNGLLRYSAEKYVFASQQVIIYDLKTRKRAIRGGAHQMSVANSKLKDSDVKIEDYEEEEFMILHEELKDRIENNIDMMLILIGLKQNNVSY